MCKYSTGMCTMYLYLHYVCGLSYTLNVFYVNSPICPSQRSRTWPIFELDVTINLRCTCAKFHHTTAAKFLSYRENRRTDRRTQIQNGHIKHSCGILDKAYKHPFHFQLPMKIKIPKIICREIQQKPARVLQSPEVVMALKIHMAVFDRNFVSFFRLVSEASYMTSCLLHRYFFQIRANAIRSLLKAHTAPQKFKVSVSFPTASYNFYSINF